MLQHRPTYVTPCMYIINSVRISLACNVPHLRAVQQAFSRSCLVHGPAVPGLRAEVHCKSQSLKYGAAEEVDVGVALYHTPAQYLVESITVHTEDVLNVQGWVDDVPCNTAGPLQMIKIWCPVHTSCRKIGNGLLQRWRANL